MFVFGSKDKILAHLKQTYPLTRQNESPRSSLSSLASPLLAGFTRSNSHHGKAAEKPPTQQSLGNYELCGSIGSYVISSMRSCRLWQVCPRCALYPAESATHYCCAH